MKNLDILIGKQFKYKSKHGLSDWTDTIKSYTIIPDITINVGYTLSIIVYATNSYNYYKLNEIIILT